MPRAPRTASPSRRRTPVTEPPPPTADGPAADPRSVPPRPTGAGMNRPPEGRLVPAPADSRFQLVSDYEPRGDQPTAIAELTEGILRGDRDQVLLGVTGSGKTFTTASVLANLNRPALVLAHNKTLAAQLYQEFKTFFPENAVE